MQEAGQDRAGSGPSSERQPQQIKALFLKNLKLQSKQMGTNICQVLTPILCIMFTFLMKKLVEDNIPVGAIFEPLDYPFKFNDYTEFDQINIGERDHLKWIAYKCRDQCDPLRLGINDGEQKAGILGAIDSENNKVAFHPNVFIDNNTVKMAVPFFLPVEKGTLSASLFERLSVISKADIDLVKKGGGLDYLPDGALDITVLNQDRLQFDVKVNDVRDLQSHRSNGVSRIKYFNKLKGIKQLGEVKDYNQYAGIMEVTHMLTAAFTGGLIEAGYMTMLEDPHGVTFVDTIINLVTVIIFPISLSLLFPVFLYSVVLEKEEKLIQMMKMNGMKIRNYWFVYFLFCFILSFLTNLIFYLLGYFLTRMRFFVETSPLLMLFVLLGWSLAQIGMAVFFQTFLSKSRSANIIGYLVSIWTCMIASTLCIGVYQYPSSFPYGLRMFAPFGFVRILYLMLTVCSEGQCYTDITNIPSELKDCILFLYLSFLFFFFFGTYLFEVIPQELGVTRSPLFPLLPVKALLQKCLRRGRGHWAGQIEEDEELRAYISKEEEDPFSKRERSDIQCDERVIDSHPLVINNLRKLYRKPGMSKMYPAVRSFNLKVGPKETFGLLGPNGAGKTTLISMISGMYQPDHGNAWIGGHDIKHNIEKAQLQMGVCPQFDLLWPEFTVEEHLYFYARLKGIPVKSIDQKVKDALEEVNLTDFKAFPSSSLSGGMKRRLSVAISLVGDPKIVFLDEPSTGLDPDNRRKLWEVLGKCQKDRAIFITTHMMEEADTLCNRVGIVTSGVLRTVGPQTTLKTAYGKGYRLTVSTVKEERKLVDRASVLIQDNSKLDGDNKVEVEEEENLQLRKSIDSFVMMQEKEKAEMIKKRVAEVSKFIGKNFDGSVLEKNFNGYLIFKVPLTYKVSEIFMVMEKMQVELDIVDVAITTSSLQDVFMNVVKEYGQDSQEIPESFVSFPNQSPAPLGPDPLLSNEYQSIVSKNRQSVMSGQNIQESDYF